MPGNHLQSQAKCQEWNSPKPFLLEKQSHSCQNQARVGNCPNFGIVSDFYIYNIIGVESINKSSQSRQIDIHFENPSKAQKSRAWKAITGWQTLNWETNSVRKLVDNAQWMNQFP